MREGNSCVREGYECEVSTDYAWVREVNSWVSTDYAWIREKVIHELEKVPNMLEKVANELEKKLTELEINSRSA